MEDSGLGRGLDSLLPEEEEADSEAQLKQMPLDLLEPNPDQPRDDFNEENLSELTNSIKEQGLIEPLLARPAGDDNYEIIAGERRWRAAVEAGLNKAPVIIRDLNDGEALALSLVENIQRENLNPLEEARAYRDLKERQSWGQQKVAEAVGKSRSSVANRLRLLELPDPVKNALVDSEISAGHARALLGLPSEGALKILGRIKEKNLSVRQTEKLVSQHKEKQKEESEQEEEETKASDLEPEPVFRELESDLEETIGAPVEIKSEDRKSGHIRIHFNDPDEFELIRERLANIEF